ncbi:unnamed protein product [Rotaria magnacalcarata]|uniref:Uncharacterized protein n=1 Tax=Rotaria magnacalcarata TaxID=392030 RepID=A0A816PP65_9BILA|nr:unnamed protein product [Rotaria magnacalcarata]CAF1541368.1 unnamed protein product [Rotaria magnacalcarata]CAF2050798.1 unnamed protein product [Rotaria magnacalcarata]CAF2068977.1 unnamed protein product [Rotaria magnacalcarata]CAF2083249.1 unnamed protein product [Rotaria magnacalcarata]
METIKTAPLPQKAIIASIVILILLISYSLRGSNEVEVNDKERNISLCQIRARFDGLDGFDDRTLLLLLAELKMQDFLIGQPVWGPLDTLIYLCEHRLKVGLKLSKLEAALHKVIINGPESSTHLAWSCA